MTLVGVNEAATALGVNPSTVSRQVARFVAEGLLSRDAKGQFDLEAYKQARENGLNPLKARNRGDVGYEGAVTSQPDDAEPIGPSHQPRGLGQLGMAQAADKAISARIKQLDLAKRLGKVVDRASAEAAGGEIALLLREGLRGRNRQLAESIVALTDPNDVEVVLDREDEALLESIRSALQKQLGPKEADHVAA